MKLTLLLAVFVSLTVASLAEVKTPPVGDLILSWQVDGVTRDGMVHIPPAALTQPVPIVFAWHGHGGTMGNAVNSFGYHKLWPEAISVYLQGLNTPGRLTDPEGKKPGWQGRAGDQGDRDLKLFDAVLAHGGSISAEHGIGSLKVGHLTRYKSPVAIHTMRAIKQALDPQNLMNPGRILSPAPV